jgi:hypothetical protein
MVFLAFTIVTKAVYNRPSGHIQGWIITWVKVAKVDPSGYPFGGIRVPELLHGGTYHLSMVMDVANDMRPWAYILHKVTCGQPRLRT